MEKKKRYYPPKEGNAAQEGGNGQRISVRPGNFNPPAPQGQKKQEGAAEGGAPAAQGAHQGGHGRNRNRNRRRSDRRSGDPLNGETLGEARKQGASIFEGEEEHDPFDIDLSAATYNEDEEVTTEGGADEE